MKRVAVIDIGTNSVKLSVADVGEETSIVREDARVTRLGKDVDRTGRLAQESMDSTLAAIRQFADDARSSGAQAVVAAGTSALRDADNGAEFLRAVKSECGLEVDIIAGEREAVLAYHAVTGDPAIAAGNDVSFLVFDIGGGSTELIWGRAGAMQKNVSLNIGAVRLTERHIHTDPPTEEEFQSSLDDASSAIESFVTTIDPVTALCGVGGTAVTLASIALSTRDVHGRTVTGEQLEATVKRLCALPFNERRTVNYLDPARADIIVAGGSILMSLLRSTNVGAYKISVRGMRYALLLEQAG